MMQQRLHIIHYETNVLRSIHFKGAEGIIPSGGLRIRVNFKICFRQFELDLN